MKHLFSSVILFCVIAFMTMTPLQAHAERPSTSKPQWVSKGESSLNDRRSNSTYFFKVIQNIGSEIQQLRNANTNALADFIGKRNQIEGLEVTDVSNTSGTNGVSSTEQYNMVFKNRFSTEAFYASLVDEYWEEATAPSGLKEYHYYALYAVSTSGNEKPVFDRFEVTREYGAAPIVMSIIPGVGQLYKGQKLKGSMMLGSAAIGTAAIILCENRRSYYQTRILEQPKFAKEWSKKRDDWQTGRNIAIGVTGALVAWSIIDAAISPGTTRIKISHNTGFAFQPVTFATPQGISFGATVALHY